jgi:hypothetical protein
MKKLLFLILLCCAFSTYSIAQNKVKKDIETVLAGAWNNFETIDGGLDQEADGVEYHKINKQWVDFKQQALVFENASRCYFWVTFKKKYFEQYPDFKTIHDDMIVYAKEVMKEKAKSKEFAYSEYKKEGTLNNGTVKRVTYFELKDVKNDFVLMQLIVDDEGAFADMYIYGKKHLYKK